MADRRYKLIGKGLVGDCDFLVEDLTNGDYIQWDSTAEKWVTATISITPDALYWNDVDIKAQANAGGIDITGDLVATSHVEAGVGSGSIALTVNDGYGNANLAFNHRQGSPDVTGSSGRIECSVDNAGANMYIELGNSTTVGVPVGLTTVAHFATDGMDFYENSDKLLALGADNIAVLGTTGDGPYISFWNDAETSRLAFVQATTNFYIRSEQHGVNMYLECEDAGGTVRTMLGLDPDLFLVYSHNKEVLDVNDTYLRINQNGDFASGTYTPNAFRCDDYINFHGTDFIQEDQGNYGNISSSGTNSWDGWSIMNDTTFMMSTTDNRLYNDLNNENYAQFIQNGTFRLYYNNVECLETNSIGNCTIDNLGAALHHGTALTSGRVTISTSAASGGSNGDVWFRY